MKLIILLMSISLLMVNAVLADERIEKSQATKVGTYKGFNIVVKVNKGWVTVDEKTLRLLKLIHTLLCINPVCLMSFSINQGASF